MCIILSPTLLYSWQLLCLLVLEFCDRNKKVLVWLGRTVKAKLRNFLNVSEQGIYIYHGKPSKLIIADKVEFSNVW